MNQQLASFVIDSCDKLLLLLRLSTSSKHSLTHIAYPGLVGACFFLFSQERDVAGQVDSGDVGRPANSAVRAHVPHDGGRGGAVDSQAGHVSETILGEIMIF